MVVVSPSLEGQVPVSDPLVIAKCGSCHARDARGNMDRISWERATPEGWQEALKKMVRESLVELAPADARAMVKYLAANHGLAPEEASAVAYYPERRIHDETAGFDASLVGACTRCHAIARALSWRRSPEDWKKLADTHLSQYKMPAADEAVAFLGKAASLDTAEWSTWTASRNTAAISGRWIITATVRGHGQYVGEMQVNAGAAPDEFTTLVTLHSVRDGSTITRSGQSLVYGGWAWRGRSRGVAAGVRSAAPDDLSNDAREVMSLTSDGTKAEGRWFWGQYQEFGFDVQMQRVGPGPTLLAVDRASLKTGSEGNRIRLMGDQFPAEVAPADLDFGAGVSVRRVVSHDSGEVVAEVDVAINAKPGRRDVSLRSGKLPGILAIYDRIDYIRVTPESAMAGFGGQNSPRGYQQFEAIGYQRGADGRLRTADDLELGPVDVSWSMEVFYATDTSRNDLIGKVSPTGLFIPAANGPGDNHDVWVVAAAANEKLRAKGYLVVTVPSYTINGRRYVRDLDRWIEEGTQ